MKTKKFFARTLRHIFASVLIAASGSSLIAHAQTTITQARQKISSDLLREIERPSGQKLTWVKDDKNNGRLVKALVIANSADPSLTAIRQAILAAGGSVYYRYVSVAGISVMLPAS